MQGTQGVPDRGWSWVVAFAACFTSLVLAGIFRTGGVLFVAFIDDFGVTREEASWPMVICISVLNLTGPFSGILGQRYGVRPIVMVGSIVGAIGVSGCFFTTSLDVIAVLFGGVFGIGYGLVNTLIPVIVNAYFLDLRGTANGIANSGSCFGSVILPVLFEFLIAHYGLSGCFLLTGGIVLNVAIAGALLRPPPWLKKTPPKLTNISFKSVICSSDSSKPAIVHKVSERNDRKKSNVEYSTDKSKGNLNFSRVNNTESDRFEPHSSPQQGLHAELVEKLKERNKAQDDASNAFAEYKDPSSISVFSGSSSPNVNPNSEEKELQSELSRAQREFQESLNDFQTAVLCILETSQSEEVLNKVEDTDEAKVSELTDSCPARHSFSIASTRRPRTKVSKSEILSARPLKKSSFKFDNSSGDLLPASESLKLTSQPTTNVPKYKRTSVSVMGDIEEEKQTTVDASPNQSRKSPGAFKSFQIVLTCPMFYVTALTNVSFYFLFHMYVVIIVDYALDCGVPKSDTKYIIFAFSAADLFGRLCLGWITDRKFITRSRFVMFCMAGIGMVFFAFPFATSYMTLVVASCGYGILLGCTMIIFPILLVDYLGIELHAVAFGCLCFMNGFASFGRPLLIGYFRDNIGSYANMFYILGITSVVAASAWLLEKCFIQGNKSLEDSKMPNNFVSVDTK